MVFVPADLQLETALGHLVLGDHLGEPHRAPADGVEVRLQNLGLGAAPAPGERELPELAVRGALAAETVRLRYYVSGWAEEMLDSAELFERLDYIEEIARRPVNMTPRIRALEPSEEIEQVARDIEMRVRENVVLDDVILYDVVEPNRLRYAHIGGRTLFANVCTPEEVRETVGKDDLIDPADNGFGDAVTRAYRAAIEHNRPIVDLVTAPVRLGGRERRWLHYKRITVPLLSLGKLAVFTDPTPSQRISFE